MPKRPCTKEGQQLPKTGADWPCDLNESLEEEREKKHGGMEIQRAMKPSLDLPLKKRYILVDIHQQMEQARQLKKVRLDAVNDSNHLQPLQERQVEDDNNSKDEDDDEEEHYKQEQDEEQKKNDMPMQDDQKKEVEVTKQDKEDSESGEGENVVSMRKFEGFRLLAKLENTERAGVATRTRTRAASRRLGRHNHLNYYRSHGTLTAPIDIDDLEQDSDS